MTQAAINYGIVLYELGITRESVRDASEKLKKVPQLRAALTDPTIGLPKKHRIIEKVFPADLHNFMKQVCDNHRFDRIEEIFEAYAQYADRQEGILPATLYYVTPPDGRQQEEMKNFLKKNHPCSQVRLSMEAAPQLLGGFVIRVGNFEYDRSVRGRLAQLKQKMIRR